MTTMAQIDADALAGRLTHHQACQARAIRAGDAYAPARAALVEGLRAIADFYEQHVEVEPVAYPVFIHAVSFHTDETGPAAIATIAAALGTEVDSRNQIHTERQMAGVRFYASYIPPTAGPAEFTRYRREVLTATAAGRVYRSISGGIQRQMRGNQNRRVDTTVRELIAAGWVAEPAEGGHYYRITEAGTQRIQQRGRT
jgi:hypothetical protein